MKENNLNNISISRLREYLPADKWVGVDNDFFIIDVTYNRNFGTFKYPCRFDDCPQEDLHYALVAMSKEFMSELKIDVNKFFNDGMSL